MLTNTETLIIISYV